LAKQHREDAEGTAKTQKEHEDAEGTTKSAKRTKDWERFCESVVLVEGIFAG
jgi:hypothetical protein